MYVLLELLFFISGYSATALLYYINHRFIFHGLLPKYVPEKIRKMHKWYAKFHIRHHMHAEQTDPLVEKYIKVPVIVKIATLALCFMISTLSVGLALGIVSFFSVYAVRHGAIHGVTYPFQRRLDAGSNYYCHHMLHHQPGNWGKFNFSGVHPFIDKIFGTYKESTQEDFRS